MFRTRIFVALPLLAVLFPAPPAQALTTQHFESPHVHPVEMSPDGTRLFAVHTAGQELAVFDLAGPAPVRIGKVPVGYEPVTVRARNDQEVWVVNHLSDAVNIVDVATLRVVRTLLPGDEPTDVAFVPSQGRAFVCLSQEDRIAVYDLSDLSLPPTYIALDHSDPRSLAVSPDGSTVYVNALDSQNATTTLPWANMVFNGGRPAPVPAMDPALPPEPATGLIVRFDGTSWKDDVGGSWNVPYSILDRDVIEIDTATLVATGFHRAVGTTLFNLAVNPVTGIVYVTNQEATNEIRFEDNLVGQFVKTRVTTIDPSTGSVTPVSLNPHINYANPAGDATERSLSLAIPMDLAVSSSGAQVYVAAMGSRRVGVLDAAGNVTRRIPVGAGPTGVALDETRNRLYVVNRFDSDLSVVDLLDDSSYTLPLGFDPSHPDITNGREFLYDAENSSAHGDIACASCHVFGDMDGIAWELGSPLGAFVANPNPAFSGFHPIKGPMITQTLRGLSGNAPFHWRGDFARLSSFNPAFVNLQGAPSQLSGSEMNDFEDFITTMISPPHPNRNIDNSLPPSFGGADPVRGEQLFNTGALFQVIGVTDCVDCHHLPTGARGTVIPPINVEGNQDMVIPHLRNLHEKTRFDPQASTTVRGFGFLHDGVFGNLRTYFKKFGVFTFNDDTEILDVEAFMHCFGTETHPAVGAQWTADGTNAAARVDTLITQADQGLIGIYAKGHDGSGQARGWVYRNTFGVWSPDRAAEPDVDLATLVAGAGPGTEITFTAVLPGEQVRLGIDRDEDGFLDRDELDVGADPDDPASNPGTIVGTPWLASAEAQSLWLTGANPTRTASRLAFALPRTGTARVDVFDVRGRRVRTLLDSRHSEAGRFETIWDLTDAGGHRVATGTYFVRLSTPLGTSHQRVVVLR